MRFTALARFPGRASRAVDGVCADDPWVAALWAFEQLARAERQRCSAVAVMAESGAETAYSARAGRLVRCSAVERPAPAAAAIGRAA